MTKAALGYLKIPNYTLQNLKKQRLEDWYKNGDYLLSQLEKYRENYRLKICSKCIDTQQQKDRNCFAEKELDSNGNLKTRCNHMIISQNIKFRDKFEDHNNFHPIFYNPPEK